MIEKILKIYKSIPIANPHIINYKLSKLLVFIIIYLVLIGLLQSLSHIYFPIKEFNYLAQPFDLRGFAKGGLYFGVYVLCVLAILLFSFVGNRLFFVLFSFFFIFTYSIDFFIQYIGSYRGFSLDELIIAYSQKHLISNMKSYTFEILSALVIAFFVFSFLFLLRSKIRIRLQLWFVLLVYMTSWIAVDISDKKVYSITTNSYPAPIKTTAIIFNFLLNNDKPQYRILNSNILPSQNGIQNIWWVIDESVTAKYMSLNGYKKPTTPKLKIANDTMPYFNNLGIVNSISNCSNFSNLYLRIGLNPDMSFESQDSLPSILSYAKNAGYKIVMADAQILQGEITNFLVPEEILMIDKILTLDREILPHERDNMLLEKLLNYLKNGFNQKYFILFIKFGCHWPYSLNFNNKETVFSPIQPNTFTRMVPENKELIVNTYLNSIFFNVDVFLTKLVSGVDPHYSELFYTSDHGQGIILNGSNRTHCSSNIDNLHLDEFNVPLITYGRILSNINRNKFYSQIQIFPTTLELMGYEKSITNKYGISLFDGEVSQRRSFMTGTGQIVNFDE